jgi:hypothetical protein
VRLALPDDDLQQRMFRERGRLLEPFGGNAVKLGLILEHRGADPMADINSSGSYREFAIDLKNLHPLM